MQEALSGLTLAISSGHDLSLALLDGNMVLAERQLPLERGHAERMMPALRALLLPYGGAEVRPSAIVVDVGPGSFTGLRIGMAAARALGLAWGCPVAGVRSTLLVAAATRSAGVQGTVLVALAAPRGQIWLEAFDLRSLGSLSGPVALQPDEAAGLVRGFPALAGTATTIAAERQPFHVFAPTAAMVALVPLPSREAAVPLYIRPGEALAAA